MRGLPLVFLLLLAFVCAFVSATSTTTAARLRVRKNIFELSRPELRDFFGAINKLKYEKRARNGTSTYDAMVALHSQYAQAAHMGKRKGLLTVLLDFVFGGGGEDDRRTKLVELQISSSMQGQHFFRGTECSCCTLSQSYSVCLAILI